MGKNKKHSFKYVSKKNPIVLYRAFLKDGSVFGCYDNLELLATEIKDAGVEKKIARYDKISIFGASNGWKKIPKPKKSDIETFSAIDSYHRRNSRTRNYSGFGR